jgi:hypothetical protein
MIMSWNQETNTRWRHQEHASQALLSSHGNNDRDVTQTTLSENDYPLTGRKDDPKHFPKSHGFFFFPVWDSSQLFLVWLRKTLKANPTRQEVHTCDSCVSSSSKAYYQAW